MDVSTTVLAPTKTTDDSTTKHVDVVALSVGITVGIVAGILITLLTILVRKKLRKRDFPRTHEFNNVDHELASMRATAGEGVAHEAEVVTADVLPGRASPLVSVACNAGGAAARTYSDEGSRRDEPLASENDAAPIAVRSGSHSCSPNKQNVVRNICPQLGWRVMKSTSCDSGLGSMSDKELGARSLGSCDKLCSAVSSLWNRWVAYKEGQQLLLGSTVSAPSEQPFAVTAEQSLAEMDQLINEHVDGKWVISGKRGCIYCSDNFAIGVFDEAGGELQLERCFASLHIPKGALTQARILYLGVYYEKNASDVVAFTPAYECGPSGLQFKVPLQLRVRHCAPYESRSSLSAFIHDKQVEPWRQDSEISVNYLDYGQAVLYLEHFTGFRIGARLSQRSSTAVISKNLWLCCFVFEKKLKMYYCNQDDHLLEKIKWHVKQPEDIQAEVLQLPLTVYDTMGKVWVSFSGTDTVFMEFDVNEVLRHAFGFAESSSALRVTSMSVGQKEGTQYYSVCKQSVHEQENARDLAFERSAGSQENDAKKLIPVVRRRAAGAANAECALKKESGYISGTPTERQHYSHTSGMLNGDTAGENGLNVPQDKKDACC